MCYAFDEFRKLKPLSISSQDPIVRYLCALVSELTYHHVPEFEIDSNRRAKIVPCEQYIEIVNAGISHSVSGYLDNMDFTWSFVEFDRGVVVVGLLLNGNLFVGFRGTVYLYDWKINLCASLVEPDVDFQTTELEIWLKVVRDGVAVIKRPPGRSTLTPQFRL